MSTDVDMPHRRVTVLPCARHSREPAARPPGLRCIQPVWTEQPRCCHPEVQQSQSNNGEVIHMIATDRALTNTAQRITQARTDASLSQRQLAQETGIPQTTVFRIESGKRSAKMSEIFLIASTLGCGVSDLTGHFDIRDRVECAAPATDGLAMTSMKAELIRYLELDAYLEDQGIALQA